MKINIKIQDTTYQVKVGDMQTRPILVEVDGEQFEVWPEEAATASNSPRPATVPAALPEKPSINGNSNSITSKPGAVSAPIPGVIIEIKVSEGETVAYGQELCVLEAMKMKNSIRASRAGKVKKIHISVGDQVQQGKLLVELADQAA